jgi:hypothetical protein
MVAFGDDTKAPIATDGILHSKQVWKLHPN